MSTQENTEKHIESLKEDIRRKLDECRERISEPRKILQQLDGLSVSLPSRLSELRVKGYVYRSYLEKKLENLIDGWMKIRQSFLTNVNDLEKRYKSRLKDIELQLRESSLFDPNIAVGEEQRLESIRLELESLCDDIERSVDSILESVRDVEREFASVKWEINNAEQTLDKASRIGLELQQGEFLYAAFTGTLLGNEKAKCTVFLTNRRFIIVGEKDIVLKKILFIPVKKKKTYITIADMPIGYVKDVKPGKVGFFRGKGVYITAGTEEFVIDMEDYKVDTFIKHLIKAMRGDIDNEVIINVKPEEKTMPKVVQCPYCGAPVKVPLIRGVTSIKCEYCGSIIHIK
ncbi:MAG: hypothetical protein DRJ35_00545 [Thermoprotei archaeon]|nr:MAG: hypothetical protein DRJ35_00545 [Thermoprotei archaeon]